MDTALPIWRWRQDSDYGGQGAVEQSPSYLVEVLHCYEDVPGSGSREKPYPCAESIRSLSGK